MTLSVLSLLVASVLQIVLNLQAQQKYVAAQQELIAWQAADEVSHFIEHVCSTLELVGRVNRPISRSTVEQRALLEHLLGLQPAFRQVTLLDDQGQELVKLTRLVVVTSQDLVNQADSDWFGQVRQKQAYFSSIYIDDLTNEPLVTVAMPLTDAFDQFEGALVVEVNLRFMWNLVDSLQIGEEGRAYVVDREGTLIAFGDISRVLRGENVSHLEYVDQFLNNQSPSTQLRLSKGINNQYVISTYVPLETPDWAVVVELPAIEAYQPVILNVVLSIGGAIMVALLASVAAIYLSRRLVAPLRKLTETTTCIAQGQWEFEAPIQGTTEVRGLAQAFNRMVQALKRSEEQLKRYHKQLEELVEERTKELTQTVEHLKATQKQLIESEKMAALGRLVATIAHEINTPIGVGVTAASTLENETKLLVAECQNGGLKRSSLKMYLHTASQSSQLILSNLQRAADLVHTFKLVTVDQSRSQRRSFALKSYLETTLRHLDPQLKRSQHTWKVKADETITLNSYPTAFSQVVTNLVMNSLTHAYQEGESGQLSFECFVYHERVIIEYADDGCGMTPNQLSKIFEPFFSSPRHRGGSGLGLHIVYNLVTQTLGGTIRCESEVGVGTKFILSLPH